MSSVAQAHSDALSYQNGQWKLPVQWIIEDDEKGARRVPCPHGLLRAPLPPPFHDMHAHDALHDFFAFALINEILFTFH